MNFPKPPAFDPSDIDKQNNWMKQYRIDPIKLGRMCEQFPGLQNSWNQFIITYQLCKDQYETNRQITSHTG
jgi:hypothetical protein